MAPSLVTTPAILLRSHPYSESSRVLRFYTRELGLVGVMAKGAGRVASKGRGGLGTFAEGVAAIAVREDRDLQSLYEFAPTDAHLGLGGDLRRLGGASVAAELALRHAEPGAETSLYERLSQGLSRLETAEPHDVLAEALALVWGMVDALGFTPELSSCTVCGRPVGDDELVRFVVEAGGVVSGDCSASGRARRVGPRARDQLRALLAGEIPADLARARAHLKLLDDFVTAHLLGGRRLGSFRFLDVAPDAPSP